jgi:energy-coupling factor transporter ATP-binding protein EcfA2
MSSVPRTSSSSGIIIGLDPTADVNPFPGLRPFEPDEDYLFFGRERQTDELLRRLRTTRFLSVLGRSGSGKSSLVRSGLIPSLHGGAMTRAGSRWRVAIMRPGENPIGNLAAALTAPEALGAGDDERLTRALFETTLRASRLGLVECVRQSQIGATDNVLVLVDQFEEIFRYKRGRAADGADDGDEAAAFVKLLLAARESESPIIYIAITMRSDFIGDCMEFGTLPEVVNDGLYLVPRMTREELRLAITGPVAVGGATIAPRLVSRLLNDVGDDPDQLPILQHALMRTWDRPDRRRHSGHDHRHELRRRCDDGGVRRLGWHERHLRVHHPMHRHQPGRQRHRGCQGHDGGRYERHLGGRSVHLRASPGRLFDQPIHRPNCRRHNRHDHRLELRHRRGEHQIRRYCGHERELFLHDPMHRHQPGRQRHRGCQGHDGGRYERHLGGRSVLLRASPGRLFDQSIHRSDDRRHSRYDHRLELRHRRGDHQIRRDRRHERDLFLHRAMHRHQPGRQRHG